MCSSDLRDVRKGNTYRTDTFHSGEFGILGYADADHEVVYYRKPFRAHTAATEFDPAAIDALPKVAIVYAYSGDDGSQVKAAVDAGAAGIVSGGVGAGGGAPAYTKALQEASEAGVAVVQASHVGTGRGLDVHAPGDEGDACAPGEGGACELDPLAPADAVAQETDRVPGFDGASAAHHDSHEIGRAHV